MIKKAILHIKDGCPAMARHIKNNNLQANNSCFECLFPDCVSIDREYKRQKAQKGKEGLSVPTTVKSPALRNEQGDVYNGKRDYGQSKEITPP